MVTLIESFLTASRTKDSLLEKAFLDTAERQCIIVQGRPVAAYRWGKGAPSVLLVHGWGGKSAQFRSIVPALLRNGYSAMAVDAPAHGRSAGTQSSLFQFRSIVSHLINDPAYEFRYVVAHSMGAASVAMALSRESSPVARAVLISPICRLEDVVSRFLERMGIFGAQRQAFISELEELFGLDMWFESSLADVGKRIDIPVLIIHDRDDQEIPWQDGFDTASACRGSELVSTSGLGHRSILYNQSVVDRIGEFLGVCAAPSVPVPVSAHGCSSDLLAV